MIAKKGTRKDNPRPDWKHNLNKGKKCAQATPVETRLESYVEVVDQQELVPKMPDKKKARDQHQNKRAVLCAGRGPWTAKHQKREQRQSSHSRVVSHRDEGTKQENTSVNSQSKMSHELGATFLHEHYINTTNGCRHPLCPSKSRPPRSLLRIQGSAMTLQ